MVLEKTLESPLDCKEIKPVNPKGNQSWIFIGRIDAEAEAPILWPPDVKKWLIRKVPDTGKDWKQEEKGTTEDEMVGWHHQLNGHEINFRELVMDRDQVCCSPMLSHFSRVQLCVTPQTAAHQAPPSLGFSRQEYWSGLPFPSPMHEREKWKWSRSVVSDS